MDIALNLSTALAAYRNRKYPSIRAIARAFSLSEATLCRYLAGGVSRATSHESSQYLSTAEEEKLIKWLTRLDRAGHAISPAFTRKLAFEIRDSRPTLSSSTTTPSTPTPFPGKNWIDKLRTRYPAIKGAYTRSLELARVVGSSYSTVEAYFDALSSLFVENSYLPNDTYNFDESGFSIGTSISTRVRSDSSSTLYLQGTLCRRARWLSRELCV